MLEAWVNTYREDESYGHRCSMYSQLVYIKTVCSYLMTKPTLSTELILLEPKNNWALTCTRSVTR